MAFEVTPACADVQIENRETADIVVHPRRKKVAFVGFASNSLHMVPWEDPSFEIWGMNQGAMNFKRRADRWFEMHLPEATPDIRDPKYLEWLKALTIPVYMIDLYDYAPTAVRYPIEEAIKTAGRDYFMSTVAFMAAIAEMEDFEEIHLYGINLAIGDEYFYEKPNAEWWLGRLAAQGRKVYVPRASWFRPRATCTWGPCARPRLSSRSARAWTRVRTSCSCLRSRRQPLRREHAHLGQRSGCRGHVGFVARRPQTEHRTRVQAAP